jgi:hypothetical protein
MRGWLRAAGAERQSAPAALIGRFWAAPQLPLSEGSISQLDPDTSVSFRDGEVPYIR